MVPLTIVIIVVLLGLGMAVKIVKQYEPVSYTHLTLPTNREV